MAAMSEEIARMMIGGTEGTTSFACWREQCGLTQEQAAEALGLSRRQVQAYEKGESHHTGDSRSPKKAVRVLMSVIAEKIDVKPWPE
jgi:DNA-binding transcriptional regulator YiaG